jgi:hypothetical protein
VWELAQDQLYTKTTIPSTYQAVEYIESTGTQYINTGAQVFSGTNHKIELDFSPTSFYDYNSLWGCTTDADTWEGWIYSTGQLASRYNGNRYGDDNAITVNTRYKYIAQKEGATLSKTLNGTVIGTGTAVDKTTTGSLTLFLSGSDYGKYKIYGCRLWGNGGIVRDLRPCYRKSDNAIGLYDTISGTFYTNSGTGTFTKGSNVSGHWSYGPAYVKVDGAWKVAKQVYTKVNGAWVLNGGASKITFTIKGTTYEADAGMTWTQWVASSYNTLGATVNSSLNRITWESNGTHSLLNTTHPDFTAPSDVIISGHAYGVFTEK